jgi:hypothetical protein
MAYVLIVFLSGYGTQPLIGSFPDKSSCEVAKRFVDHHKECFEDSVCQPESSLGDSDKNPAYCARGRFGVDNGRLQQPCRPRRFLEQRSSAPPFGHPHRLPHGQPE